MQFGIFFFFFLNTVAEAPIELCHDYWGCRFSVAQRSSTRTMTRFLLFWLCASANGFEMKH